MDITKKLLDHMKSSHQKLELPPPSMQELKPHFISLEEGKSLAAEFPFQRRFSNPLGIYQGGFLAAAFDEVFGPLSYSVAKVPCATINFSLNYIRPFQSTDRMMVIAAEVTNLSKNFIVMKAEARNQQGKILAVATMQSSLLKQHL